MPIRFLTLHAPASLRGFTAAIAAGATLVACKGILDVDNPNNVGYDAFDNPAAAGSIVNGAENSTARGLASMLTPYSIATDETYWVGSRDAYAQLDIGDVSDPNNEYVDAGAFRFFESRWLADRAILSLETFNTNGTLLDESLLARALINGAVVY